MPAMPASVGPWARQAPAPAASSTAGSPRHPHLSCSAATIMGRCRAVAVLLALALALSTPAAVRAHDVHDCIFPPTEPGGPPCKHPLALDPSCRGVFNASTRDAYLSMDCDCEGGGAGKGRGGGLLVRAGGRGRLACGRARAADGPPPPHPPPGADVIYDVPAPEPTTKYIMIHSGKCDIVSRVGRQPGGAAGAGARCRAGRCPPASHAAPARAVDCPAGRLGQRGHRFQPDRAAPLHGPRL